MMKENNKIKNECKAHPYFRDAGIGLDMVAQQTNLTVLICVPVQDLATPIQSSFLSLSYESSRVQPKFLGPHGRPEEALAPWLQIGPAMATPIWGMNKWTDVISFCVSFSL